MGILNKQDTIHSGDQFKKIFGYGAWYLLGSLLTKVSSFLLLPVYTRYLSPADYGVLSSLMSVAKFFPIFVSLYLDAAFGRYYFFEKKISHQKVKELYSTIFWFISLWGSGVICIGIIISPYTFQPLLNIPFLPYIPLMLIPVLFSQLGLLGSIFLRSNLRARELTIVNFIGFLCSTSIVLYLLVVCKYGIKANLCGMAFVSIFNFGYFLFISIRHSLLGFCFKWNVLKTSLVFSVPLMPNIAAGWIAGFSDRLILAFYGKIEQVGLYSVSAQIALVLYMLNDAMTQVQGPIGLSALTDDREKGKKQISEFLSFFIWGILFFYLALTFFSKEILYVMTDAKYHSAYKLVGILAFLYVMSGIYRVFSTIIAFNNKMWIISSAAIISAVINMILNFIFIPHFGQWAAAWASFFSIMGYTLWIVVWAQKIDPIPINVKLIIPVCCLAFILLAIQQSVEIWCFMGLWSGGCLKLILILIYLVAIFIIPQLKEVRIIVVLAIQKLILFVKTQVYHLTSRHMP